MRTRALTLLAAVACALSATLLAAPAPARADGWENRIQLNNGQTYTGRDALVQVFGALPQGNSTLTLFGDCEYDFGYGTPQQSPFVIGAGKSVTINLNGFDIDVEGYSLYVNGGQLTINNNGNHDTGDIAFEPFGLTPSVIVQNGGSVLLNSGEISGDNGPALQVEGGSFTMAGGKVDSDVRGSGVIVNTGGTVTIGGGTVENGAWQGPIISGSATTVVNGGTFEPTAIPASMLGEGRVQVSYGSGGDTQYTVGTNDAILTYLGRLRWGTVTVVNGTLDITRAIPSGVTVASSSTGALQVNGTPTDSYTGTGQNPSTPGGEPTPPPSNPTYPNYGELEAIWRLYNPYTHGRFYCDDRDDAEKLMWLGWQIEGVGWYAPEDGVDVYQLWNPYSGDHYWTMDSQEYFNLQRLGWRGEGDVWESAPASVGKPIYQLYNPYVKVNSHLWTADEYEVSVLVTQGWLNEGAKWYAAALPPQ